MKTSNIPDFPKIKINNYISKLSDNVKIIPKEGLISKFITKSNIKELTNRLGLLKITINNYIKNNKYPIVFIKELNELTNKNIFTMIEQEDYLFFSKWKKINLPRFITPKLAYFIGYLQGDGSIESNEYRIDFCDEYLSQMNKIKDISYSLFGLKGRMDKIITKISKKHVYKLEIGSIALNSYLSQTFDIEKGVKSKLNIPKMFLKNREILKWYLTGLFDADGTLPKEPSKCKQFFIDITFKDKGFIEQVKEQLNSFGIETYNPYCRVAKSPSSEYISKTWELRIRKKEDIIKFLKKIGFSHPDKQKRVTKLLEYVGQ